MSKNNLWKKCTNCKVNCCKNEITSYPLFLTPKEGGGHKSINNKFPCKNLNKKGLCSVYDKRPTDCRLFPFDIINENNEFYWAIYKTECPISKLNKANFKLTLKELEQKIIPKFKKYIKQYAKYKLDDLKKYKLIKLRKVNLA